MSDVRHGTQYGYRIGCRCPECVAAKHDEYLRNREGYAARNKRNVNADREARREYDRRYYAANREKALAAARRWSEANPDRARQAKARWQRANPENMLERVNRRRARRLDGTVVSFTAAQLAQRLSMFPGCWICGADPTEVDHVKPLAKGGIHALCNLRPICTPCNRRKSARWPFAA